MKGGRPEIKILEIGFHPPPVCGWSIQTTMVKSELRRRGFIAAVLNINESRKQKSPEYVDVQNGFDYLRKLVYFAARGYKFHIHFNALSRKGYVLSVIAVLVGKMFGHDAILSFHGGVPQQFFPVERPLWLRAAFKTLFHLGRYTTCDSEEIRQSIISYGIDPARVKAIPCISAELLDWKAVTLSETVDSFLSHHFPVFFSYVRLRPEYGFDVLLEAIMQYTAEHTNSGFIWVGPSVREVDRIKEVIETSHVSAINVLLLPNVDHDQFMTIMGRCFATIRAHSCDGVSASVLESLSLGLPVIACNDGRRPAGVITYDERSAADLVAQLKYVTDNSTAIKAQMVVPTLERNTDTMVELLASICK